MGTFAELLGECRAIEAVRQNLRRLLLRPLAGRRLPAILIRGETGTGKGLVARLIHRESPRAAGPFVDVNCAAIPETLVEAELFGYERGAFTDARRSKPGLFQAAHRGTIFLDEIGLLPAPMQAKLLKVLEDQAVRRLGSNASEPVDAAIISATNADLAAAVAVGHFREDLYHRVAVLTVELPPLRARGQDIVLLANRFLAQVCSEYGMTPKRLTAAAEARLAEYDWPGNIRELSNLMERVALLGDGDEVGEALLELPRVPTRTFAAPNPPADSPSLEAAMRDHLLTALEQTHWNISRTATLLGISRNTVRARIERFGLVAHASGPAQAVRAPKPPVRSLPPSQSSQLVQDVVAGPATIRWDRRRVAFLRTCVIATGSVELLPDTSRALEMLVQKTGAFGGRVIELGVTGITAAFGLEPVEDAPRRAALAATAMHKAVQRDDGADAAKLLVKSALHVAPIAIAHVSAGIRIDEDAKRPIESLLDGLIAIAEPDDVLVSAGTAPQLERRFELTRVRSIEQGLPAYRLGRQEALGLSRRGRMASFVGRTEEMAYLRGRLEIVQAGRGQVVGIVGHAGIGKSRLLFEFRQSLTGERIRCLGGRCASYGTSAPYLPVLDLVRAWCGITEWDAPEVIRGRLRVSLEAVGMDPDKHSPYLLHLLGDVSGTAQLASVSPEAIKMRTFEALRHVSIGATQGETLLLVVEDLHWIDRMSEEFFSSIMSVLPGSRLLFVCTYRPGYTPPWANWSFASELPLAPLSKEESLKIVTSIVSSGSLPAPVTEIILNRAEGNPFFLEELALTVHDRPDGSADVLLPDTLQGVLATRFERLPNDEQALLQLAAVIGRDVPVLTLATLAETTADALAPALHHLQMSEFLTKLAGTAEVTFSFRHGLTHDVVYDSLPLGEQSALHARVLDVMERLYVDRTHEHVDRLAYHAVKGGSWTKALTYLRLAGTRALERSALREAATYFEQALTALQHLPDSPALREQAIDVRFDLRNALQPRGGLQQIFMHLQEAEALAKALGDQRRLGRAAAYLTDYFRLTGDRDRAIDWGQRAVASATESGDAALQIVASTWLGQVYFATGDYQRASVLFRENVRRLHGELTLQRLGMPQPPAIHSRTCLCWCLAEIGDFVAGIAHGREAVALAVSADHPLSHTVASSGLGWLYLRQGVADEAIEILEFGLDAIRAGNTPLWFPRVASALGYAYALAGRLTEAVELAEAAVAEGDSMQLLGGRSLLLAYAGEVYVLAGRLDEARQSGQRALVSATEQMERGYEGWALRLLAETAVRSAPSDSTHVANFARRALTIAQELGMRPLAAHAHLLLGRSLALVGDVGSARSHLSAAVGLLESMNMSRWLGPARDSLERLT